MSHAASPPEESLDEVLRRVDGDRWLSSRFIGDGPARQDVVALYAYDYELERADRVASNPLIAEIRLTWWREVLDQIFGGEPVRYHPTALALDRAVKTRNLPRAPLEAMIDRRIEGLGASGMDWDVALLWAGDVGGGCAGLAALCLGGHVDNPAIVAAGRVWGLLQLRRKGMSPEAAPIRELMADSRKLSHGLQPSLFPVIAHVALAGRQFTRKPVSDFEKRIRILAAVALGRI